MESLKPPYGLFDFNDPDRPDLEGPACPIVWINRKPTPLMGDEGPIVDLN